MPGYCDSLSYDDTLDTFSSVIEDRRAGYEEERYRRADDTYQHDRYARAKEPINAKHQPRRPLVDNMTSAWRRDEGGADLNDSTNEKAVPPMTHTCHYNGDEPPSALMNRQQRSKKRSNLRVTFKDLESSERWTESEEYWERKSLNLIHEKSHGIVETPREPASSLISMFWHYVTLGNR